MIKNKAKILIFVLLFAIIMATIVYYFTGEKIYTSKYYNPKTQTTIIADFVIRNGDTINQGKFIRLDKRGNKLVEGSFLNGQFHGEWNYYFDNGKIKKSYYYKNNEITLESKHYDSNGLITKYDMYDLFGKLVFVIYFDEQGVMQYNGNTLMETYQYKFSHKELYNIKKEQYLKLGDTLKYEYLLANIPNATRNFRIENLVIDNRTVKRKIVNKPPTILEVKEVLTKKGINTIRAIVQYKFKDKITPVFNDTISFNVTVN